MSIEQLRKSFIEYYRSLGYVSLPPSSVVSEGDSSVLFTTAGMQQFKPYYSQPELTKQHAVTTVQPVIRTSDISEVGDHTHLTMFEMLGNFRFGQVDIRSMKEKAIEEAWVFVCDHLKIDKSRIHVTVFAGDHLADADTDSEDIWQRYGVRIVKAGRDDNFWGPTGSEGPCGPTTEIYIDGVEVWNLVFNQYYCDSDNNYTALDFAGLDTGSGLERLATTLQGKRSIWEIEPFSSWVEFVSSDTPSSGRVIVDHVKASVFLISAGIRPGNKGRDYILRRLIRKAVFLARSCSPIDWQLLFGRVVEFYTDYQLSDPVSIMEVFEKEKEQFERNLARAVNHLNRWQETNPKADQKTVTELAFYMYESFGFPKELVVEHLISQGYEVDATYFEQLFTKHQEVSRSGATGQFKGGLADHNEKTIKHHTAHHLLLAALRQVLGPSVVQRGSNVTSDRLRIDVSFDRKISDSELKEAESIVNTLIKEDVPVVCEELPRDEALASGALAEFGQKYGETVTVYSIGDFSKELCGGPHVERTGHLGNFEIIKEEASSQGVRRIKARLS